MGFYNRRILFNFLTLEMQDLIHADKRKKGRKRRTVFTEEQLKILEESFRISKYASKRTCNELSIRALLEVQQIRVWFQNRRAKSKRKSE